MLASVGGSFTAVKLSEMFVLRLKPPKCAMMVVVSSAMSFEDSATFHRSI